MIDGLQAIISLLRAAPDVTAIVNTRIFRGILKPPTQHNLAVTVHLLNRRVDIPSDISTQTIQISCWGYDETGVVGLADRIERTLNKTINTRVGTVYIMSLFHIGESIMYEPDTKLWHVPMTVELTVWGE